MHYSKLVNGGSGRRRRQVAGSEIVTFPANTSSGVVSGLQEGQQYRFSVSVSLLIGGQTYNGTPGEFKTAITGTDGVCLFISPYLYKLNKRLSLFSPCVHEGLTVLIKCHSLYGGHP